MTDAGAALPWLLLAFCLTSVMISSAAYESVDADPLRLPGAVRFLHRVWQASTRHSGHFNRPRTALVGVAVLLAAIGQTAPVVLILDPNGTNGQGLTGQVAGALELAAVFAWLVLVSRSYNRARFHS